MRVALKWQRKKNAKKRKKKNEAFGIWQIMGWPTLRLASAIDTLLEK